MAFLTVSDGGVVAVGVSGCWVVDEQPAAHTGTVNL